MFDIITQYARDLGDAGKFLSPDNYSRRRFVIYSESASYFRYFEGIYDYLVANTNLPFSYISSDPRDAIFQRADRVDKYYINHSLPATFARLDSDVVLLTVPDLGRMNLNRPTSGKTEFIYIFHALVSTHLQYNLGAFDHYDTIFTVGEHHDLEIRETESLYGLPSKNLFQSGYHLTEKLFKQAQDFVSIPQNGRKRRVLIAPSWSKGGIFESCVDELIATLLKADFETILRPHPEFVKRYPERMKTLEALCKKDSRLVLETNHLKSTSMFDTDLLITDRSGICFEYAFARQKPVLFIDTPLKIHNPEYERLKNLPVEISTRSQMGLSISPEDISSKLIPVLEEVIVNSNSYGESILNLRNKLQYNWMGCVESSVNYILSRLK